MLLPGKPGSRKKYRVIEAPKSKAEIQAGARRRQVRSSRSSRVTGSP